MSFLDLASAINIISEMNCGILRKEFLKLSQSLDEHINKKNNLNQQIDLSEFFKEEPSVLKQDTFKGHYKSIGHQYSTRIGVQKGSTLMKALKEMKMSDKDRYSSDSNNFDILKKQRRENLIAIIKINGFATIKDIKDNIKTNPEESGSLMSCSEKTLQRELLSMVKDGVLNKPGEKRWSRYVIKLNTTPP